MPTGRRRGRAACALAIALIAALTAGVGCGEKDEETADVQGVGQVKAGSVASLAQCRDWNAGTEVEKLATIEDIREQVNLEDAPVEAPALSDEEAYDVFENACANDFSASFRLYKLYSQADAFAPLTR